MVVFIDVGRYAPANVGALAVAMAIRNAKCGSDFSNRPSPQALLGDNGVLAERLFVFPRGERGISAVVSTVPDELMDAIKDHPVVRDLQTAYRGVSEEATDKRIPAEGARVVQMAEQVLCGSFEGSVRVRSRHLLSASRSRMASSAVDSRRSLANPASVQS